jgi:hypothetical protein
MIPGEDEMKIKRSKKKNVRVASQCPGIVLDVPF